MSTASQLVHVASYLSLAEAEAARMRLAMDEIPVWLSNAALVSWAWHYSNAAGGVKLSVSEYYVPHALLVLSTDAVAAPGKTSPWDCPGCGTDIEGSWHYCWSCGTSKTGQADPDFHAWYQKGSPARRQLGRMSRERLAMWVSLVSMAVFVLSRGSIGPLLVWAMIVLLLGPLFGRTGARCKDMEDLTSTKRSGDQADREGATNQVDQADESGDQLVVRMWAASVFGVLWSPLFLLLAAYYARRVKRLGLPLRPIDRWRYRTSWICVALGVVFLIWDRFAYGNWLIVLIAGFAQLFAAPLH